jgi:hypothetical protein
VFIRRSRALARCLFYLPPVPLTYASLTSLQSQVDLGKASTSQDRLERQLDILQVHQKQISDALNVMEAEAEHLSRWVHFHDRSRYSSPQTKLTFLAVRMFRRSPQHSAALHSQTSSSQETLYSLAESISAHLSSLGDALHGIVPSSTSAEEVRKIEALLDVACATNRAPKRTRVRTRTEPFLAGAQFLTCTVSRFSEGIQPRDGSVRIEHRVSQRSATGKPTNLTLHRAKNRSCLCRFALA